MSTIQTKPEVFNTNTSNSGQGAAKSTAAAGKRVNVGGLNLPVTQAVHLPSDQRHETLFIPSSSTPAWGSYYTIDIREKNILLHNITLQFNYATVVGSTNPQLTGYFNPSYFHWNRIEIYQGGSVIDTIYGNQQFIMNQFMFYDEDRLSMNNVAGNYASVANRTLLSSLSTPNTFYCPLRTYFDQTKMALLTENHSIQLRVYTDLLANVFYDTSGTLTSSNINSVNAICEVTRLDASTAHNQLMEITKQPHHSIMHDCHYGTFNIPLRSTATTLVLSSIVGNIAALFFTCRTSLVTTSTASPFNYIPITSFHLLDSASTSLVGGQPIPSTLATNILNMEWCKSSYNTENALGAVNNSSYVYMWSFSADILSALESGRCLGSRKFVGQEQLMLVIPSNEANIIVDVYALAENVLEQNEFTIKKVSM